MYYVYVLLEKETGENYIGYSSDLRQRVERHKSGTGAKMARKGRWELVYYEAYLVKADATRREYRLKHDGRARRQLLDRICNSMLLD